METAQSAAGRRKARKFRKYKQLSFFVACFALFTYLVWHSEPYLDLDLDQDLKMA
jgi:ATP/ADP translocase